MHTPRTAPSSSTFRKRVLVARIVAGLAFSTAAEAAAATVSETRTETRTGPATAGSFEFPKFDPTRGTLESVTITIEPSSRVELEASGINSSDQSDLVSVQVRATLRIEFEPLINSLTGSTSFSVPAHASATSWFAATGPGASHTSSDEATLLRWSGSGSRGVTWELADLVPTFQSAGASPDLHFQHVTLGVTVTFTYTATPMTPPPLRFDPSDGTFQLTEVDRPVVVEWRRLLVDATAWSLRHQTGSNAPGTIVRFPLEGDLGFYRVRFQDAAAAHPAPARGLGVPP